MKYSNVSVSKRRRTYSRLLGDIHHELNQALVEECESRGLSQQDVANAIGKEKSFVSRKMNGLTNMTLETLADLAFALDRAIELRLRSRNPEPGSNRSWQAPASGNTATKVALNLTTATKGYTSTVSAKPLSGKEPEHA